MSFREFDAEKHDREEQFVNKSFIWQEFLKAHGKWQGVSGGIVDACDLFKAQTRHFKPYGKTWAEVKAAAIEIADRKPEETKLLRQVTYSYEVGVDDPDMAIPMPAEPETPAEWRMVCASWQPTRIVQGEQHGRWVWFWEGAQKEPLG